MTPLLRQQRLLSNGRCLETGSNKDPTLFTVQGGAVPTDTKTINSVNTE